MEARPFSSPLALFRYGPSMKDAYGGNYVVVGRGSNEHVIRMDYYMSHGEGSAQAPLETDMEVIAVSRRGDYRVTFYITEILPFSQKEVTFRDDDGMTTQYNLDRSGLACVVTQIEPLMEDPNEATPNHMDEWELYGELFVNNRLRASVDTNKQTINSGEGISRDQVLGALVGRV